MQSAILATAYEDTDTLAIMLDSTDDNIKAISNAMMSTAPQVSQLKADIASGNVRPEFEHIPANRRGCENHKQLAAAEYQATRLFRAARCVQ